jgi:hypothetical protein
VQSLLTKLSEDAIINIEDENEVHNLEQAKKYGDKSPVTDIAINKVPKVDVPGFSDEQNILLQEKHKSLLKIAKFDNNSNEVLEIWNMSNGKTINVLGDENSVILEGNIDAEAFVKKASNNTLAFLHNHPNVSPFSLEDIRTFARHSEIDLMTIVSNQGAVHVIRKTADFDAYKFLGIVNNIGEEIAVNGKLDSKKFFNKLSKEFKEGGVYYGKS